MVGEQGSEMHKMNSPKAPENSLANKNYSKLDRKAAFYDRFLRVMITKPIFCTNKHPPPHERSSHGTKAFPKPFGAENENPRAKPLPGKHIQKHTINTLISI